MRATFFITTISALTAQAILALELGTSSTLTASVDHEIESTWFDRRIEALSLT